MHSSSPRASIPLEEPSASSSCDPADLLSLYIIVIPDLVEVVVNLWLSKCPQQRPPQDSFAPRRRQFSPRKSSDLCQSAAQASSQAPHLSFTVEFGKFSNSLALWRANIRRYRRNRTLALTGNRYVNLRIQRPFPWEFASADMQNSSLERPQYPGNSSVKIKMKECGKFLIFAWT